ncbi:MAG: hypothetical protein MUC88_11925, partial [Planctomycetes bacterium]|nr:hypothetical protein [Planctomycetota bacterium]
LLEHASIAYLGGFCRRNKFNPTLAASWEGFGTDYAALVLRNRRDSLQLAVYNFAAQPLTGRMRLWSLAHGVYRLTVGPDANGDFQADRAETDKSLELARADVIDLTIQPGAVTIVTLEQERELDSIFTRADLAIAAREIELRGKVLSGTVHNLGSADVQDVVIAVVTDDGRVLTRKSLGPLAAPLDLVPRRLGFTLELPGDPHGLKPTLRLLVDAGDQVLEIYEGNNAVRLAVTP